MPARSTLTDMAELHLHVGLYKTGTSTIQAALDTRVDALATAGVLYPGGGHRAHRLATYDLLGQRVRGEDVAVAGAFLVTARRMAPGEKAPLKKRRPAPGAYGPDYGGPRPPGVPVDSAEG